MKLEEFRRLFEATATGMNWERAQKDRWKVSQRIVDNQDDLRRLITVWTNDGIRGTGGIPLRVGEVANDVSTVGPAWGQKILRIAHSFSGEPPSPFCLPAMNIDNESMLMDGCHRTTSIAISRCRFSILLCEISPPANAPIWTAADMVRHVRTAGASMLVTLPLVYQLADAFA